VVVGREEREDGPAAADAAHGGVGARDQVGGAKRRDLLVGIARGRALGELVQHLPARRNREQRAHVEWDVLAERRRCRLCPSGRNGQEPEHVARELCNRGGG